MGVCARVCSYAHVFVFVKFGMFSHVFKWSVVAYAEENWEQSNTHKFKEVIYVYFHVQVICGVFLVHVNKYEQITDCSQIPQWLC
jgi:hypothetical protein